MLHFLPHGPLRLILMQRLSLLLQHNTRLWPLSWNTTIFGRFLIFGELLVFEFVKKVVEFKWALVITIKQVCFSLNDLALVHMRRNVRVEVLLTLINHVYLASFVRLALTLSTTLTPWKPGLSWLFWILRIPRLASLGVAEGTNWIGLLSGVGVWQVLPTCILIWLLHFLLSFLLRQYLLVFKVRQIFLGFVHQ